MARAVTKCPGCGSPVSQFAAGCAICGENLTAARQARERRREAMPSLARPAWFPEVTATDAILGTILVVAAYAWPLLGGPIAGVFAYFAHQKGDVIQRNLALVAVAVAVVIVLVSLLPGTGGSLLGWTDLSGPLSTN
jgi:hypothetical protein